MRLRFAPAPTGALHLGSALVAVANALVARNLGAGLALRIDDTDAPDDAAELTRGIVADLEWLELELDGPPTHQSARVARHRAEAARLLAEGAAYRCFCTPGELAERRSAAAAAHVAWRYDGRCAALGHAESEQRAEAGEAWALRLRVPAHAVVLDDAARGPIRFEAGEIGDFVVARADGRPTYDLASCVDDCDMDITQIIRGEDHLANSARHAILFAALGAPLPKLAHVALLVDDSGARLSKRTGAPPLASLRERGVPAPAVVGYLAQLAFPLRAGDPAVESFAEHARRADLSRLATGTARFDEAQLARLAQEHLAALPAVDLAALVARELGVDVQRVLPLAAALHGIATIGDGALAVRAVLDRPAPVEADDPALTLFRELRVAGGVQLAEDEAVALVERLRASATERGIGARDVLHPVRRALTGADRGLALPAVIAAIERDEALLRTTRR